MSTPGPRAQRTLGAGLSDVPFMDPVGDTNPAPRHAPLLAVLLERLDLPAVLQAHPSLTLPRAPPPAAVTVRVCGAAFLDPKTKGVSFFPMLFYMYVCSFVSVCM